MKAKNYLLTLAAATIAWTATGFADHHNVQNYPSGMDCKLLRNVADLVGQQNPGTTAIFYSYKVVKEDPTGKQKDKYASTKGSKANDKGILVLFPSENLAYIVSAKDRPQSVSYPMGTIKVGDELKLSPKS